MLKQTRPIRIEPIITKKHDHVPETMYKYVHAKSPRNEKYLIDPINSSQGLTQGSKEFQGPKWRERYGLDKKFEIDWTQKNSEVNTDWTKKFRNVAIQERTGHDTNKEKS